MKRLVKTVVVFGCFYGNYFNAQSQTTGGGFGSSTTLPIRKGHARAIAIQFL